MGIAVLLLLFGIVAISGGSAVARRRVREEFGEVTSEAREQATDTPGLVPGWTVLLVLAGWASLIAAVAIALAAVFL